MKLRSTALLVVISSALGLSAGFWAGQRWTESSLEKEAQAALGLHRQMTASQLQMSLMTLELLDRNDLDSVRVVHAAELKSSLAVLEHLRPEELGIPAAPELADLITEGRTYVEKHGRR